ncbi:integrase catalytic domain-containing protein [Trichonephila clavipes]|nr:integrase catalytic domain-containing protein [Trichonephila clavipes]
MDAETATVLRGRAKAALTRIINFIDKNDQTFDKNDIRNKLEKLELTYTEFDKADAALPIESSEMEEFETKYYETKAKLQNILENLSVRTYVYNDNSDVFENVSNMKSSNFKLPKINIERFSGDYKNWPSFKDLYVSLVHDNMCLSNIQKFQYLRGLLLTSFTLYSIHEDFYQKLWLTKTDWDSPIPQQLTEDWLRFQKAFNAINYLTVPRWVILTADNIVELHGFADASSLAYAAAIYCRQKHNGKIKVQLLVSKTKVAPVKQVSIPRLELCGAHLLSKLFKSVLRTLKYYTFDVFAWTDSKIVLSWLSGHPRQWKTFVANRTSEIIEVLPTKHWRHVPSKENPADIASRGIDPKCLPDCKLWWQGPPWLRLETSSWPKAESSCDEASDEVKAEQKSVSIFNLFTHTSNDVIHGLFEHYSSLTKVIRIFAYCQRFIKNCKKIASQGSSISSSHINTTSLTFSETKTAEETIIRWMNMVLVRVGGRLQNSQLRFNSKHPIILPSQHSISELLIKEQHIAHLHAGPTLLAHVLRQSHWIVGSRKLINKCIRKCLKCNKFKTSTTTPQLMGNLPKHRVTLERPFFSCGIDYAGPVLIKCNKGRGTKSTIALFVCLATKAVHIEAVGDLTTDSFIAALRRFSARRGAPRHIYSDNGTNFVGARRKLDEIRKLWLSLPTNEAISYYLSKSSIDWHFIPPSSPHFGGIWESGIRSVKFHLKRVLGETILTFEELTTLLTQIEGLLNSGLSPTLMTLT